MEIKHFFKTHEFQVRISIKSAEGKKCVRSYRVSKLEPSSTTTMVLTLAIPNNQKEGALLYLAGSENVRKDF